MWIKQEAASNMHLNMMKHFNLAIDTAEYYGLSDNEAKKIVEEISAAVGSNWEKAAVSYKLSRESIERMRPAFSACDM